MPPRKQSLSSGDVNFEDIAIKRRWPEVLKNDANYSKAVRVALIKFRIGNGNGTFCRGCFSRGFQYYVTPRCLVITPNLIEEHAYGKVRQEVCRGKARAIKEASALGTYDRSCCGCCKCSECLKRIENHLEVSEGTSGVTKCGDDCRDMLFCSSCEIEHDAIPLGSFPRRMEAILPSGSSPCSIPSDVIGSPGL